MFGPVAGSAACKRTSEICSDKKLALEALQRHSCQLYQLLIPGQNDLTLSKYQHEEKKKLGYDTINSWLMNCWLILFEWVHFILSGKDMQVQKYCRKK